MPRSSSGLGRYLLRVETEVQSLYGVPFNSANISSLNCLPVSQGEGQDDLPMGIFWLSSGGDA